MFLILKVNKMYSEIIENYQNHCYCPKCGCGDVTFRDQYISNLEPKRMVMRGYCIKCKCAWIQEGDYINWTKKTTNTKISIFK